MADIGPMLVYSDVIWGKIHAKYPVMSGDTALPGYLCDTGYSSYPSITQTGIVKTSAKVDQRCSYCNVRALPEDRFCEGCGAPV